MANQQVRSRPRRHRRSGGDNRSFDALVLRTLWGVQGGSPPPRHIFWRRSVLMILSRKLLTRYRKLKQEVLAADADDLARHVGRSVARRFAVEGGGWRRAHGEPRGHEAAPLEDGDLQRLGRAGPFRGPFPIHPLMLATLRSGLQPAGRARTQKSSSRPALSAPRSDRRRHHAASPKRYVLAFNIRNH